MHSSSMHSSSSVVAAESPVLKPRLTPYMKYDVDPDVLLKELSQVDSSSANSGLTGWSPKHSRRRPARGVEMLEGSKAHMNS